MAAAILSGLVVLFFAFGIYAYKQLRLKQAIQIAETEDIPFLVSSIATLVFTNSKGEETVSTKAMEFPFSNPHRTILSRSDFLDLCNKLGLEANSFVQQVAGSDLVMISLKDLLDWQSIYTRTPPDNYHYSFSRGPDYEEAQVHMPNYLFGFHSHISGDIDNWLSNRDYSKQVTYNLNITSMLGEKLNIHVNMEAVDPSAKRKEGDFQLVSVVPEFAKMNS